MTLESALLREPCPTVFSCVYKLDFGVITSVVITSVASWLPAMRAEVHVHARLTSLKGASDAAGKMTDQELAAVRGEIDMLTRLKHDGIAGCRGSWQDEKHLYSVEEYGIRGDLFIEMFSDRHATFHLPFPPCLHCTGCLVRRGTVL